MTLWMVRAGEETMSEPLTKERKRRLNTIVEDYGYPEEWVRSAVEGLKKEILSEQRSCIPEYLGREVIKIIDKWFPVFKEEKK